MLAVSPAIPFCSLRSDVEFTINGIGFDSTGPEWNIIDMKYYAEMDDTPIAEQMAVFNATG